MSQVRVKNISGVPSALCCICFRSSPITHMVLVDDSDKKKRVCRDETFKGSCEAKFYAGDPKAVENQFKQYLKNGKYFLDKTRF